MRETKDMLLRLPPEIWRQAKIHSIDTGESVTALITRLLAEYFANQAEKTFGNK